MGLEVVFFVWLWYSKKKHASIKKTDEPKMTWTFTLVNYHTDGGSEILANQRYFHVVYIASRSRFRRNFRILVHKQLRKYKNAKLKWDGWWILQRWLQIFRNVASEGTLAAPKSYLYQISHDTPNMESFQLWSLYKTTQPNRPCETEVKARYFKNCLLMCLVFLGGHVHVK